MLLYSPRWLFLYPGILLAVLGAAIMVWLLPGPQQVGSVRLDVHTLLYAAMAVLVGVQTCIFAIFSKVFALTVGLLPVDPKTNSWFKRIQLEAGLVLGTLLTLTGLGFSMYAVGTWGRASFGTLDPSQTLRAAIPGVLTIVLGLQIILSSFFLSVLGLRHKGSAITLGS